VNRLVASILALAVGVAACSPPAPGPTRVTAEKTPEREIKIAMIAKSSSNPFFLTCRTGAEAAAKEIGAKEGLRITIDWRTPPEEDGQVQAQRLAQAVNEGAAAVMLAPSDGGKLIGAIADAEAKGVPVLTFDADIPESKRFAFVGSDNYEMGYKIGEELVRICDGKGTVALLCGNQNAPNLAIRRKGTEDALKKAPGMRIAGVFYNPETPQDAAAEVLRVSKSRPEVDAWAFIGGWPLFTTTLLTDIDPARVRVVSADALPPQLEYVERGVVPVLVAQRSYDFGYQGVRVCVDKVLGKDPADPVQKTDLTLVTRENLRDWAKDLKAWGFADVPAKYLE